MQAPASGAAALSLTMMNAADAVLSPERVAQHPDKPAILFNDEAMGYAQLLARVNRFGNALARAGVRRENRVMLLLKDTPDMVAAYLGTIKAGGVTVAINVRCAPYELAFFLADSRATVLLVDAEFLPTYQAIASQLAEPPKVFVTGAPSGVAPAGMGTFESLLEGASERMEAVPMSPDDMALWMYTSGTTGTPKAAVHLQHNVLSCLDFCSGVLGGHQEDRLFATSKLFFAYANSNSLFASFTLGATTVLLDAWPDSATIARVMDRHQPTLFFSVPTLYRNLLRDGVATKERFAGVRHCVSAGERLPVVLQQRWREATGHDLIDAMGTTETIFMMLANRPGEVRDGSSGKPTPNTRVELRDADGRMIEGAGQPGVLWVQMASTADRYWNNQARSNGAFHGPWFRTGDMYVRDADGYYFQEGRADDMLKISGQWVSPAEIEDEVLKLPGVADAAVVGAANAEGLVRLALFVLPNDPGADPEALAAGIQQSLVGRLSVYKCPREVRVVSEIPRTATGKVQRFKLREAAKAAGQ